MQTVFCCVCSENSTYLFRSMQYHNVIILSYFILKKILTAELCSFNNGNLHSAGICHVVALIALLHIKRHVKTVLLMPIK